LSKQGARWRRKSSLEGNRSDASELSAENSGIAVEVSAPRRRHANVMARCVQCRVHRRIQARMKAIALQSRLGFSPIGSRDRFLRRAQHEIMSNSG
jgi:hypothetical protein